MITSLATYLAERSRSERALLLLLPFLCLSLAFIAFVALPLINARSSARADLLAAEAQHEWYVAHLEEIVALPPLGVRVSPTPVGLGQIEASLVAVGLRDKLERLAVAASGGVELTFVAVPFAEIMIWIDEIGASLALRVVTLSLLRNAPGHVDVQLEITQ